MQHNNLSFPWAISGWLLNAVGGVLLYFQSNAGAFTVMMGLLAWLTGLIFQYRKDRREQQEHEHRMQQLQDKRNEKDGNEEHKG